MGVNDPNERIPYRGVILDRRTAAMVDMIGEKLGRPVDSVPQGINPGGVSASGGTHDGPAVDIFDRNLPLVQRLGRSIGFAGWHRLLLPGVWNPHFHGIPLGEPDISDAARGQIPDYRNYRDGLASHAADPSWHPFKRGARPRPIFNYREYLEHRRWSRGEVFVGKLQRGQKNSDSVARLQYRLKHHTRAQSPGLDVDGDYGKRTVEAVMHWQRKVGKDGPDGGLHVTEPQANRIFGNHYAVHG